MTLAQDVTERRLLEEQLRQSQKMEAVGLLAGGIAHDFNNLLNVVYASTELGKRAEKAGLPASEHLDAIALASSRAADLTKKLLAFSRKQVLTIETLDLCAAVAELTNLLARTLGEDIELDVRLDHAPLWVRADAGQLQQTLLNLCTNARQAMPAGGRLSVHACRAAPDEAYARALPSTGGDYAFADLCVRDTGCGMDEATRARMFEPFFTTKMAGSGLGLAVVHGIVEQHHGRLHVESAPGAGTTVRVLLPLMEAPSEAPAPAASPQEMARGGSEVLLVVEDQPALRNLLAQALGDVGYDVVTAEDGIAAVEICRARSDVRLVLLDLVMPRLGGREAYFRLKALDPEVRVLFMTGYAPDSLDVSDLATGPDAAVLAKPFLLDALERQVRELLDRVI